MARCYDCGVDLSPGEEQQVLVDFVPTISGYDIDFYEPVCRACAEKRERAAKELSWVPWLGRLVLVAALVSILVWVMKNA